MTGQSQALATGEFTDKLTHGPSMGMCLKHDDRGQLSLDRAGQVLQGLDLEELLVHDLHVLGGSVLRPVKSTGKFSRQVYELEVIRVPQLFDKGLIQTQLFKKIQKV